MQVAERLRAHARRALRLTANIRRATAGPDKELDETLADIEAMARLGEYYGAKILGAVELCAFRKAKDARCRAAAIEHLTAAVEHWRRYAKLATGLYRPQLLARTRRLDWNALLADVRKDVEIARRP